MAFFLYSATGIYIMQNTMVRGGRWPAGKKNEIRSYGKKIKKGKEKRRKITSKKGKRALKMHLFGL